MRLLRHLPVLLPLAACSSVQMPDVGSLVTPYRIDVRQGNFVTQEMVGQLKPGMTRDQVRFILGTPLLADIFHADRWDYIYNFRPGHGEPQLRRLAVFFVDDKLARVAGDVVGAEPGEPGAEAAASGRSRLIEIAPLETAGSAGAAAANTPQADDGSRPAGEPASGGQ